MWYTVKELGEGGTFGQIPKKNISDIWSLIPAKKGFRIH